MTSEEIDVLARIIMNQHRDDAPTLIPACAAVVGMLLRSAPHETARKLGLAIMVSLMWAESNPEAAGSTEPSMIPINPTAADAIAKGAAPTTAKLIGLLGDLYRGLLLLEAGGGEDDATPVLNAWLSAHLELTVEFYGAERAAAFLREAADGLVQGVERRDALRAMDERATHDGGRA